MSQFSKRDRSASLAKAAVKSKGQGKSQGMKSLKLKTGPKTGMKSTAPRSSSLQKIKISRPKSR